MQSAATKNRNLSEAANEVGTKISTDPASVTSEDATYIQSRQSRAQGGGQPIKGSVASQAQSIAAANEVGAAPHAAMDASASTTGTANLTAEEQSQLDREANYVEQADQVATKMQRDPGSVTKGDADTLHSREHRAFGAAEKGGVSAQAQHQVAENQGATR